MSDLYSIISLSLIVNLLSTIIATVIGVIIGYILYFSDFKLKPIIILFNKTMMGLPPVVLGLILFLLFKRDGSLGFLQLLYTPYILLIAQVLLILPIVIGNVVQMLETSGKKLFYTLRMYGVKKHRLIRYSIAEYRNQLLFIFILGLSRAVSEVGAVFIVGGNIAGSTRMMTTAIATLKSAGDFNDAITLGVILIVITFIIQILFERLRVKNLYENI